MQESPEDTAVDELGIKDFRDMCYLFNQVAKKDKEVSLESFKQQYSYLYEEVKEIEAALENKDVQETLDGVIDVLVVALGMLQKLGSMNVSTSEALIRVARNNLMKFVYPENKEQLQKTIEKYKDVAQHYYNEQSDVFVFLRDSDGKVMKPVGFKAVVLDDLTPLESTEVWK